MCCFDSEAAWAEAHPAILSLVMTVMTVMTVVSIPGRLLTDQTMAYSFPGPALESGQRVGHLLDQQLCVQKCATTPDLVTSQHVQVIM
jgi:hypothetical protein